MDVRQVDLFRPGGSSQNQGGGGQCNENSKSIFKILTVSWAEILLTKGSRSLRRGTVDLYR